MTGLLADLLEAWPQNTTDKNLLGGVKTALHLHKTVFRQRTQTYIMEGWNLAPMTLPLLRSFGSAGLTGIRSLVGTSRF